MYMVSYSQKEGYNYENLNFNEEDHASKAGSLSLLKPST